MAGIAGYWVNENVLNKPDGTQPILVVNFYLNGESGKLARLDAASGEWVDRGEQGADWLIDKLHNGEPDFEGPFPEPPEGVPPVPLGL